MSGKRNISQLDQLLLEIGLKERVRDSETMRALTASLIHPARLSESGFLADDDPLKISARFVIEDFEAITNGMSRPDTGNFTVVIDEESPLYPWKLLNEAVAAFYKGDTKTMIDTVRRFPKNSAVANLNTIFEELAGKPPSVNKKNLFTDKIRVKNKALIQGLEILDEAASYPDLLRKELSFYIRELSQENQEAGKRLYYWAMEILSEDEALDEKDEISSIVPGTGEASRICALASMRYDPERALTAWLRSLNSVLEAGEIGSAELNVRLKIAGELLKKTEEGNVLSADIFSKIIAYLTLSFPLIKAILPAIPMLPKDVAGLQQWLTGTAVNLNTSNTVKKPKRKTERKVVPELLLFEELS